ncbi:MAG TPA: RIP metalloprotease RseP [Candidatus Methylomirabilis sp.]|nr:RIP metalloprotease RseP [Candidatus Methylomirabilis sp.]
MEAVYLIVGIVLVLGVMVLIHEWGHFVVARMCKVRVDVFSIGFGPRLFGWKKGPTDYRISALPLGGYVRMAGQDPTEVDSQGRFGSAPGETVPMPTGAADELMSKKRWQRALISCAGPFVNLVFPIFLLSGMFAIVGVPYPAYLDAPLKVTELPPVAQHNPLKSGETVLSVNGVSTPNWEQALIALKNVAPGTNARVEVEDSGTRHTVEVPVQDKSDSTKIFGYAPIRPIVDQVGPGTPAEHAGLREGDLITAVNGKKIDYWEQFQQLTRSSNGQPMTLDVTRKGKQLQLTVTPKKGAADPGDNIYEIGIGLPDISAYKHVSFGESVRLAGIETGDTVAETVDVVGKLFSGRVSIKQLQGPVGISHMAGQAVRKGPSYVINLMVVISINLGILNLLPIPILDGGNILLLAIEGVMRRDLSMNFKERFVQVGLVFLLVIFAIVMYNDILRRIASHG